MGCPMSKVHSMQCRALRPHPAVGIAEWLPASLYGHKPGRGQGRRTKVVLASGYAGNIEDVAVGLEKAA